MSHDTSSLGRAARWAAPIATAALLAGAACHQVPGTTSQAAPLAGRATVITEEEIGRMSVRTAWDVVRLRAPRLRFGQDAAGRPTGVRIQEPRSVNADETPLVIVDGSKVGDLQYLTDIPASDVHVIRILDGEVATQLYGIDAASGAIVVETKHGQ
ncbi:MAG TPA: TonB-dependent receptor plug domain-containing protein [Gemmatimonadales bacterium]|nr:TonB-dependent receptor plug domain-containing protein [Gemmatimonadales bacterium]